MRLKLTDGHKSLQRIFALNCSAINKQQAIESLRKFIKDSFRSIVSCDEKSGLVQTKRLNSFPRPRAHFQSC